MKVTTDLTMLRKSVLSLMLTALSAASYGAIARAAEECGGRLAVAAKDCLGREMWKPGYGLASGKLGCAAAVSNVLKKAGVKNVSTASVTVLRKQLLNCDKSSQEFVLRNGEGSQIDNSKLLKMARPGDVVVAFMDPPASANSGPKAHCGIMAEGTDICTNNWMDGIWTELDIHLMFDYYPYIRLIRLHSADHERKPIQSHE